MNKRIYTYWVNLPGKGLPGYIELCMQTWFKNIPGLELFIISHDNVNQWAGNVLDMEKFVQIPPAMQSDIAHSLILAKHGGVFIDADTIIFKDIFKEIARLDPSKLTVFGYPGTLNIHMAILICPQPGNRFAEAMADETMRRMDAVSIYGGGTVPWDYFANDIIRHAGKDETLHECIEVLDRTQSGNILESNFNVKLSRDSVDDPDMDAYLQYTQFYFGEHTISVREAAGKVSFGAVSLHNTWTPDLYKELSPEATLALDGVMLSSLLRYALEE